MGTQKLRHDQFRSALLAALGLLPTLGCGGNVETTGSAGSAGAGRGSIGGAGGLVQSGGASGGSTPGTGGSPAVGGAAALGGQAGMGVGGGSAGTHAACVNPKPLSSGLVQCEGGWSHRPNSVKCASSLPRLGQVGQAGAESIQGRCSSDADCTERAHGHCLVSASFEPFPEPPATWCNYGCVTDADCGAGSICSCGDLIGECVPASCASDADCPGALLCASIMTKPGCGVELACQSPKDQCNANGDCMNPARCVLNAGGYRECIVPQCPVPGRPFLVDGEQRRASAIGSFDWLAQQAPPALGDLTDAARSLLSESWTHIALMEHASIAAFARFTLEVLAFGAPADLVERSARAVADETRHAQAAFALASAYAGRACGPGALSLAGSLHAADLASCTLTAFLEGCVGETVAAMEAALACSQATDPAVRSVLERVTLEESEHAELAFRFVQWALGAAGAAVTPSLRAALDELLAEPSLVDPEVTDPDLEATLARHGVVSERARRQMRRQVIRDVVAPCTRALLAASAEPAAPRLSSSGAHL
ncbi:MAG TPA: ferritin-like domain-containing protein [Polyangiaceae bacterium]|nr:ferritin-like domain-containing protein [Polyangiaceae bacterium]